MGDLYHAEHDVSASASGRGGGGLGGFGAGGAGALQLALLLSQQQTLADSLAAGLGGADAGDAAARLQARLRALSAAAADADPSLAGTPPASEAAIAALAGVSSRGQGACAVCTEEYEEGEPLKRMPCGHEYHAECLLPWLRSHATCPECRAEVESCSTEYEEDKKARRRDGAVSDLMSSLYN